MQEPGGGEEAGDPATLPLEVLWDRTIFNQRSSSGCDKGAAERRHHAAWIDLVIIGTKDTGGDGGPQAGFTRPDLGTAKPIRAQACAALLLVAETQPLDLVATKSNHERTLVAIIDRASTFGLQCHCEVAPRSLTLARECHEIVAPRLMFGGRRQHAGRRQARAAAGGGTIEDDRRQSPPRQAPADGETNHTGADDRNVEGLGFGLKEDGDASDARMLARRCKSCTDGQNGRSPEDGIASSQRLARGLDSSFCRKSNPYAGMNRIRFEGFPR